MTAYRRQHVLWQLAWGLFFIFAGLLLLFDRFYLFSFVRAFQLFWPVALIALGIAKLLCRKPTSQMRDSQNNVQSTSL
jgi:hypothetical protein